MRVDKDDDFIPYDGGDDEVPAPAEPEAKGAWEKVADQEKLEKGNFENINRAVP